MTWKPRLPYACSAWGIHTKSYPALLIESCSGHACQLSKTKHLNNPTKELIREGEARPSTIDKCV